MIHKPELPPMIGFTEVEENGIRVYKPTPETIKKQKEQAVTDALKAATVLSLQTKLDNSELTNDEIDTITILYPSFEINVSYAVGDLRQHDGKLYKCIQAHTSQADWLPPNVPALWSRVQIIETGTIAAWVAGEAVALGDKRTYNSITYSCLQAHTTQTGWEPPNAAALWSVAA